MTTGIDDVLLRLGQVVAQQLAVNWLADRRAGSRRGHELGQLVGARFPLRRQQREVLDALRKVEDSAAERLSPAIARAAHGLAENERVAALAAVSDALQEADLTDAALFGVDLDPAALLARVRRQVPVGRAGLSDRGGMLYEAALERACLVLVHLVRELPEFDAASAVQTLGRLSAVLGRLDEVLDRLPETSLDAPAGTDRDEQFRRRYLESVARFYDHLEVVGLTTHHYEPRTTLTVAYLSLSVTPEEGRLIRLSVERMGLDWLYGGRDRAPSTENLRVEAALGNSTRTVIRGEAGAGKSTLLRWLAVSAARGRFTDQLAEWNGRVPFLVKLRDFPDTPPPRGDALLSQPSSPQCGPVPPEWVHRQLNSGRALLLVDGVDELTQHRRDGVRTWLRGMLGTYPDIRVVVTSRPTAVTPKWLTSEDFHSVVLEPMTTTDVQVFLRRWHKALLDSTRDPALLPCPADEVPEHERALLGQLQSRPYLRALARSPLLCAMLCALNLDRKGQLPRDRLTLYAAALDMLLERRDASRNVPAGAEVRITGSEKQTLLRELAWWLTENGRTQLDRDQAHARIEHRLRGMSNVHEDAETLLRHLLERGGVIRQPVQGKVDFVHRTFQEFLAAKEAIDRDSIDLLISNSRSDLWRETILMACAHASYQQRGRLLKGILDKADTAGGKAARQLWLLAAACKENATEAPPEILDEVHDCVRGLVPPRDVRESRSLATVGEAVLDYLPADLDTLTEAQAAACVRAAALVNGPRALHLLGRYSVDNRARVQAQLVESWRYFDPKLYAETVLEDASLFPDDSLFDIYVDFVDAIPFLNILRNLRRCYANLWSYGRVESEVFELSKLRKLELLILTGDIVPASITHLRELKELESLFLNFTSGWPGRVDFLADMVKLRKLYLLNVDSINDFTFLRCLENLEALNLQGDAVPSSSWVNEVARPDKMKSLMVEGLRDASALRRFPNLHSISLSRCSASTNLQPLQGLPLSTVGLHECSAVDTRALARLPSLQDLSLSDIGEPVDLAPLASSTITIWQGRAVRAQGAEALGPGVVIKRD